MPTAYLTSLGLKVSVTSERLELTVAHGRGGEEVLPKRRWIPLIDVDSVVVDSGVSLSTRSLSQLLRRDIPVLFLTHGHFPAGMALPISRSVRAKADQLDRSRDREFRLKLSRRIVDAKVFNQKRMLQRLSANRKWEFSAASWFDYIRRQVAEAASLDTLRGLEGAAAGRYFEIFGTFFPEEIPFPGRNRRPPRDPANALLSFGYTLLISEISLHLHACGLEPGWGFYHEAEDGRPALSLDLIEPFRAPVIDALCLDLIGHRQMTVDDFKEVDGGVMLKRTSRRKFFAALERRLEREFFSEQLKHRTTLRQRIKNHCLAMKKAFQEGSEWEPFLMN